MLEITSIPGNLKRHTFSLPNMDVKEGEVNILTSECDIKNPRLDKYSGSFFCNMEKMVIESLISWT